MINDSHIYGVPIFFPHRDTIFIHKAVQRRRFGVVSRMTKQRLTAILSVVEYGNMSKTAVNTLHKKAPSINSLQKFSLRIIASF